MAYLDQSFSKGPHGVFGEPRADLCSGGLLVTLFLLDADFCKRAGVRGVECLWKGSTNHERLRNTDLERQALNFLTNFVFSFAGEHNMSLAQPSLSKVYPCSYTSRCSLHSHKNKVKPVVFLSRHILWTSKSQIPRAQQRLSCAEWRETMRLLACRAKQNMACVPA